MHRKSKLTCLVIFISRHQSATLHMLRSKLVVAHRQIQEPCYIEQRSLCDRAVVNTKLKNAPYYLKIPISDIAKSQGPSLTLNNCNC